MGRSSDVCPINSLVGMPVVSLVTGNKLGNVKEVLVEPLNGVLIGIGLDGGTLAWENVYSLGRDAIMAESELSVQPPDAAVLARGRNAKSLMGARIVTENGEVVGRITNVLVTTQSPSFAIYGVRRSLTDWLLGREFYIPASAAYALSDDAERLIIPSAAATQISADIHDLAAAASVRTFSPTPENTAILQDEDETIVRTENEDETIVRIKDEDETILRPPKT